MNIHKFPIANKNVSFPVPEKSKLLLRLQKLAYTKRFTSTNTINLPGVGSTSVPLGNVPPQAAPAMPEIPFLPKPPPTMRDPFSYMESCVMKSITGAPVGWALGGAFGILIASWESMTPPVLMPGVPEPPGKPWKEEFRAAGRTMARKTASWSKNFAIVTAVYQGLECSLERTRAKHDIWNHGVAGCGTGTYESLL